MNTDEYYMKIALALAKKGRGMTSPNPIVGAVLVKNGKILAKGYHKKAGFPHAEIEALDKADTTAQDATLYVNLEPCNHFGRTPPCTNRIIREGIKRVVVGMRDPNPLNNGRGIKKLQSAGIDVKLGVLKEESEELNRVFKIYMTQRRPYVTIKAAQSLDGKIATYTGDSKWITNELSRRFVHRLRGKVDAVLVGINTILADDPLLNSRIGYARKEPIRVILDSKFRISPKKRIIEENLSKTIIATTKDVTNDRKAARFRDIGVNVVTLKGAKGMVDLKALLKFLAQREISHLLVEGGGNVIASFLSNKLADELLFFISPRIIGGRDAVTSVEGEGVRAINQSVVLKNIEVRRFGEDILVRGDVHRNS